MIKLYHGTDSNFKSFAYSEIGTANSTSHGFGFYFTPSLPVALEYGKRVLTLEVNKDELFKDQSFTLSLIKFSEWCDLALIDFSNFGANYTAHRYWLDNQNCPLPEIIGDLYNGGCGNLCEMLTYAQVITDKQGYYCNDKEVVLFTAPTFTKLDIEFSRFRGNDFADVKLGNDRTAQVNLKTGTVL